MYLSRLILDPRNRAVRRDLADCQALHRTVLSAFPQVEDGADARAHFGVLHRVEVHPRTGAVTLLVQSRVAPDWSQLETSRLVADSDNPSCKDVGEAFASIRAGDVLAFRLRVNPTRKIDTKSGPDGQRRNGRRVPLRTDEERLAWLERKGREAGFSLVAARTLPGAADTRLGPTARQTGNRATKGTGRAERLTFDGVTFDGRLRVDDVESFRTSLEHGIGSGKAYGFGLLSISPSGGGT